MRYERLSHLDPDDDLEAIKADQDKVESAMKDLCGDDYAADVDIGLYAKLRQKRNELGHHANFVEGLYEIESPVMKYHIKEIIKSPTRIAVDDLLGAAKGAQEFAINRKTAKKFKSMDTQTVDQKIANLDKTITKLEQEKSRLK